MSKDILALKYRPKKLEDLIGQEHIVQILRNMMKSGKIHHSFIFAGHHGVGKTSSARLFAACLNSPNGTTETPDLQSEIIQQIFDGKSVDVKEIDVASNGGIDDIRALKEFITFAPISCKYKIVILDEAHRLTGAAAEAALKMIEEPPKNVIFILLTTEPEKFKSTIHSRCMYLSFRKVDWMTIFNHMKNICKEENISYEDNALRLIAKNSNESIRDSLQNLETVLAYCGDKTIEIDDVEKSLLINNSFKYFKLLDFILGDKANGVKSDAFSACKIINEMLNAGISSETIINDLLIHLRNIMIISTCSSTSGLLFLTEEEKKLYINQLSKFKLEFLMKMIDLLSASKNSLNNNIDSRIVFETFIIKSIILNVQINKI